MSRTFASAPTPVAYEAIKLILLPGLARYMALRAEDGSLQYLDTALSVLAAVFDGRKPPIGDGLFAIVADPFFNALLDTDDNGTLSEGAGSLVSVLRKAPNQILTW